MDSVTSLIKRELNEKTLNSKERGANETELSGSETAEEGKSRETEAGVKKINSYRINKFPSKEEYKVLLIKTAIKYPINDEDFGVPMGLYVLKDNLKTTGHNLVIDIWDERLELKNEQISEDKLADYKKKDVLLNEYLKNREYDAVGISISTSEVIPALKKFKIIKEKKKETITFCGGIFTTSNEKCLLDTNLIDYVIPGMATKPLGDLLVRLYHSKYVEKKKPTDVLDAIFDIPGVASKKNIKRFNTAWICSQLPSMQLSMWPEIIKQYENYLDKRIGIYTARGCNKGCSFCSVQKESKQIIFRRSDACIVDEINFLKKQGYIYFSFKDEDFLLDDNRAREILTKIKDDSIKFKIRARYDEVSRLISKNENFLKELKEFGIDEIQYGIETHKQDIRRSVHKDYGDDYDKIQKISTFIKCHAENHITANCSFILGMAGETPEYYDELLKFIQDIYSNDLKPKIYLNYFTPHPYNSQFNLEKDSLHFVTEDLNYFTHRYPVCYKGEQDVGRNRMMLETHDKIAALTNSQNLNKSLDDDKLRNIFIDCKEITKPKIKLPQLNKR